MDNNNEQKAGVPINIDHFTEAHLHDVIELSNALNCQVRVRLMHLLQSSAEPLSVGEMTNATGNSQSAVSHHLRVMRQARIVDFEKRKCKHYYYITNEGKRKIRILMALTTVAATHVSEGTTNTISVDEVEKQAEKIFTHIYDRLPSEEHKKVWQEQWPKQQPLVMERLERQDQKTCLDWLIAKVEQAWGINVGS